jgi:cytochrome c-type biogenesis protein
MLLPRSVPSGRSISGVALLLFLVLSSPSACVSFPAQQQQQPASRRRGVHQHHRRMTTEPWRSAQPYSLAPLLPSASRSTFATATIATKSTALYSSGGMADAAFFSLSSVHWDDILYQTEAAANGLAAVSLQDPSNLITALPIMYLAGLLTSFSPCVWGLLPLTVSYITAAAGERKDQQTLLPTAAFAAGLAVVFCSLGVAAVELGDVLGSTTGTSGVLLPVLSNLICLAMGLKLLEIIDLPLPSMDFFTKGAQQQIRPSSNEPILLDATGQILQSTSPEGEKSNGEGNALARTFLLGGTSALVASPCATPVLTSILAFVATASHPALGAVLLLGYTLGTRTLHRGSHPSRQAFCCFWVPAACSRPCLEIPRWLAWQF